MRKKRLIRMRNSKRASPDGDLDITSLMDVITIILVFLLQSYSASPEVVTVPEGITLPKSKSDNMNNAGVLVQVSETKMWVDSTMVLEYGSPELGLSMLDSEKDIFLPLFDKLVAEKENSKYIQMSTPEGAPFSGNINLVVHKDLTYGFVKKILKTCAEAGYKSYKLVVLAENQ